MGVTLEADSVAHDESQYLCPLSHYLYNRSHLQKYQNEQFALTIEHVPQKNLGGKGICLTAKLLNNGSTKTDSSLIERYDFENEFSKGRYKFRGKINGKFYNTVFVNIDERRIEFKWKYNPKFFLENYLSNKNSFNIATKLSYIKDNSKSVKLACLKNAYLLAFSTLGYSFIFGSEYIEHPVINQIKEQLVNPDEDLMDLGFVFPSTSLDDSMVGVVLCRFEKFSWLQVCFDVGKDNYKKRIAVLFPSASNDNFVFLELIYKRHDISYRAYKMENIDLYTKVGSLYYWNACKTINQI